jgi:rubredoxin
MVDKLDSHTIVSAIMEAAETIQCDYSLCCVDNDGFCFYNTWPASRCGSGVCSRSTKETEMKKYVCSVCGYVYNPADGDSDSGIAAGTSFEDLPEDWVCPVCGAGKDAFEVLD